MPKKTLVKKKVGADLEKMPIQATEVEETPEVEEAPEPEKEEEKTESLPKAKEYTTDLPKVTSFSQLDTAKVMPRTKIVTEEVQEETPSQTPVLESEESPTSTPPQSDDSHKGQVSSDEIKEWLKEVENTDLYKKNYSKFMMRHPEGLKPYIVGVPVIG